jgi:GntR family transcriptional repressor for pyruvate dehydrogenase complex
VTIHQTILPHALDIHPKASNDPMIPNNTNSTVPFTFTPEPFGHESTVPALAEQLRLAILRQHPAEGTRLFSVGELAESTGFAPGVIREALQHLSQSGLIEIRQGAKGGVFARQVGYELLARSLDNLIASNRIPHASLIEVRQEIEGYCADLAATRRTDVDLAAMEASVERTEGMVDRPRQFAEENIRFHLLILRASKNQILSALVRAMRELFFAETTELHYDPEALHAAVEAHRKVMEAIRAGDARRARAVMGAHIGAFDEYVSRTHQRREDVL